MLLELIQFKAIFIETCLLFILLQLWLGGVCDEAEKFTANGSEGTILWRFTCYDGIGNMVMRMDQKQKMYLRCLCNLLWDVFEINFAMLLGVHDKGDSGVFWRCVIREIPRCIIKKIPQWIPRCFWRCVIREIPRCFWRCVIRKIPQWIPQRLWRLLLWLVPRCIIREIPQWIPQWLWRCVIPQWIPQWLWRLILWLVPRCMIREIPRWIPRCFWRCVIPQWIPQWLWRCVIPQ